MAPIARRVRWTAPRIRSLALAGIAVVWGLVACDVVAPDPHDDTGRVEIEERRAEWENRGFLDYRVTLRRICFCLPEVVGPVRVEVRQGQPVAVERLDSTPVDPDLWHLYPTVDGIFAILIDAVARDADEVSVEWDDALSFPREAFIDYSFATADEEVRFEVGPVEPLP